MTLLILTKLEERFWGRVEKTPNGCWLWKAGKFAKGYGAFRYKGMRKAHRISYFLTNGPIPQGAQVCHRCNNRACVNPSHLYLGDTRQNMGDKKLHGTGPKGEKNGNSKLSSKDISKIFFLKSLKFTNKKIAEQCGVSSACISMILNGERWQHLKSSDPSEKYFLENNSPFSISHV